MSVRPRPPTLSPANLKRVLDSARAARPLPATPLKSFALLERRLSDPAAVAGTAADDLALIEWLNGEIAGGLTDHRAHYHLPPPDDAPSIRAVEALAQDFRQGAPELEAWSLLYFRYTRPDLDLSWERFEAVTGQDQRTLRRRQERGLQRLTYRLIQHEQAARRETHRDRLRRAVPPLPGGEIVGRAALFERAWAVLTAETPRRHLALTGPGGIGKTALALLLVHRLIDRADLDGVVWIAAVQPLTAGDLAEYCAGALGLPLAPDALRAYCQARDALIVLDDAECLFEDRAGMADFLAQAAEARLVVTSRLAVPTEIDLPTFDLPELSRGEAQAIVGRIWPENRALDPISWRLIWQQAGGNPLALEVAAQLAARTSRQALESAWPQESFRDQVALLDDLYEHAWGQLDLDSRCFWLAVWLLPANLALHDLAAFVGGLSAPHAAQAAQQLSQLSLLGFDPGGERTRLHNVARAFLRLKVKAQPEIAGLARQGALRLGSVLSETPHAAQLAYHLLEAAAALGLDSAWCAEIIRAAWPDVAREGTWAAWCPVLDRQIAQAESAGPKVQAALHRWSGIACRWLGRHDAAVEHFQQVVRLSAGGSAPEEHAAACAELAVVYRCQRRYDVARSSVEQALDGFRRLRDADGEARCVLELARIALDEQQPSLALEQLRSVPVSARAAGLACDAHLALGNLRQALAFAERALALVGEDRPNLARAQATIGRVYLAMGRLPEAEDHLSSALSLMDRGQDQFGWARTADALARLYQIDGRMDEALALLESAAAQQRVLRDQAGLSASLQTTLGVYLELAERALASGDEDRVSDLTQRMRKFDAEWRALAEGSAPTPGDDLWSASESQLI